MNEMQKVIMVGIGVAAVVMDLKTGKISNWFILAGFSAGLIWQMLAKGWIGILLFAGGIGVPLLVFGVLYYFRMIGAGDIKLLCVLGGFTGPVGSLHCIFLTILWGGILSLGIMILRRNLAERMSVFFRYVSRCGNECWESYMDHAPKEARFCFSIPVLLGVLCFSGGII